MKSEEMESLSIAVILIHDSREQKCCIIEICILRRCRFQFAFARVALASRFRAGKINSLPKVGKCMSLLVGWRRRRRLFLLSQLFQLEWRKICSAFVFFLLFALSLRWLTNKECHAARAMECVKNAFLLHEKAKNTHTKKNRKCNNSNHGEDLLPHFPCSTLLF